MKKYVIYWIEFLNLELFVDTEDLTHDECVQSLINKFSHKNCTLKGQELASWSNHAIILDNLAITIEENNKTMRILPVGEFKSQFAKVLQSVKQGEEFVISYGKKKENIAVIIPYKEYKERNRIKLGLLANKGTYKINDDFKMTAEELLEI